MTEDAGKFYIDVSKGAAYDPARRLLAAVGDCLGNDIVVAPELTVESSDIDEIVAVLSAKAGPRPRLLVAGSGLAVDPAEAERPHNEAAIISGQGAKLWTHRNIAAYGILTETLAGLEIDGPSSPIRSPVVVARVGSCQRTGASAPSIDPRVMGTMGW